MSQQILKIRQPEPITNLVESKPVKDGTKLFAEQFSWEDLRGLTWVLQGDEF